MELQAKTAILELYWLADLECGYGVWTGTLRLEHIDESLAACARLLRERMPRRWLTNTEAVRTPDPEARASAGATLAVKDLTAATVHRAVEVRQFATIDAAKAWLATK